MSGPLAGIKVVEVSMWAFVPCAGAILADMGADVVKVEPPTGDPIRGLNTGGMAPGAYGFTLSWENYNRGKRSITIDLRIDGALDLLHRLLDDADVFLTSLLPAARGKMGIDVDDIRARHPNIIYAIGSGQGQHGPEAEKGGFDSISFWARAGVASSVTPDCADFPCGLPSGAFGDATSGALLAGGIAAALAQRAMTGKVSIVDVSLLGAGMWAMQRSITAATMEGKVELPRPKRNALPNPLVANYKTSDGRFVALNMLQAQRYWAGFCAAIERPDMADDPRFATDGTRAENLTACVAEIDSEFARRPLAEWRERLGRMEGQWDVVQHVGELKDDQQVLANNFLQLVDYGDGRSMKMVSTPMQFDRQNLVARPAPDLGADSDAILAELGYDEDQMIDIKVAGIVF